MTSRVVAGSVAVSGLHTIGLNTGIPSNASWHPMMVGKRVRSNAAAPVSSPFTGESIFNVWPINIFIYFGRECEYILSGEEEGWLLERGQFPQY